MNAVNDEDGQSNNHEKHPKNEQMDTSVKDPPFPVAEDVEEGDSYVDSEVRLPEETGFDCGTLDKSITSSSYSGERTTDGNDDSSRSLPNGIQNGSLRDETEDDDTAGDEDFIHEDTGDDFKGFEMSDLKEDESIGGFKEDCSEGGLNGDGAADLLPQEDDVSNLNQGGETYDSDTVHGSDGIGEAVLEHRQNDFSQEGGVIEEDSRENDVPQRDVTLEENFIENDAAHGNEVLEESFRENDACQGEVILEEDFIENASQRGITMEEDFRENYSQDQETFNGGEVTENDGSGLVISCSVEDGREGTPEEAYTKNDELAEIRGNAEESSEDNFNRSNGSENVDFKDDSNSLSQISVVKGEIDNDDPDTLTIDTERWGSAGGSQNNVEEKVETWSVVDGNQIEPREEKGAEDSQRGEASFAPIAPQPLSDDDVDPDALTIDTALPEEETPLSREHSPKRISEPASDVGGSKTSHPEPAIKLLMSDIKKIKKAVAKKMQRKKNVNNRVGQNKGKGVKRRVARISSPGALKCPRCPQSSFTTVTALLDHQRCCGTFATPAPTQPDAPKVPRKVYMCSACGSYFENWNLFLHMKEMHKRNICLHCLGMFSQAAKLTQHLATKHGIVDQVLEYGDQLSQKYPGPQFLLCSRCDKMCTDLDFESHSCSSVCSHCGLAGTHYPTCRLAPPQTVKSAKTPRRRTRAPKRPKKQPNCPSGTPLLSQGTPPDLTPSIDTPCPADDLSPMTYNERMLQLYRGNKPQERSFSTLESIEESINRVVDSLNSPKVAEEEEMDTNQASEPEPETLNEPDTDPKVESPVSPPPAPPHPPPTTRERSESESSDSSKWTIELNPRKRQRAERLEQPEPMEEPEATMAGEDVPFTCVPLPEPLDKARVPTAMKLFLRATALTCVYCAHARKIAVNAKQLALHQLAQHRYVTVAEATPASDKAACHASVVRVVREALPGLEEVYFNAYGFDSSDKSAWRSADRVYECFHCSYITPDLKEFSAHNRKIHCNDLRKSRQSESHLCIMCKTRFLSYSELLCHLCAGVYISGRIIDPNCRYRCYCCDIEPLPSSFRLMVHLRQTHTACDMCFTLCDSQAALSSHVMKHKSLFYCYACALTYETRMELSKHIFWKHGAESVTCKRCLQKKWRHAYHFCLPPPGFSCDSCGSWFKTAATLRVHTRLHTGQSPYACTECTERFISRKLLMKHGATHVQSPPPVINGEATPTIILASEEKKKQKKGKKKDLRDLFDLPPVNLSESDDSSGDEKPDPKKEELQKEEISEPKPLEPPATAGPSSEAAPVTVWDGVLASLEEKDKGRSYPPESPFFNLPLHRVTSIMLADHDYCRPAATSNDDSRVGLDHDYCNNGVAKKEPVKHSPRKPNKRRNRSSSSESSSSSSSSCSCGSNCSCSSSSSSTESASSGEPRLMRKKSKAEIKAEKRKGKVAAKPEPELEPSVDVCEVRIQESDLESDEPITDDELFYELNPALRASEVLRHNRSMLLDKLESVPSPSQPPLMVRRKGKGKKKRSGRMGSSGTGGHPQRAARPYPTNYTSTSFTDEGSNVGDSEGRRPRRKRVPLKFYGFSSGDEEDFLPMPPRKKERVVEHNTTTAATPLDTTPAPVPEATTNLWNPPAWRPPPIPPRVHPIKIRTGSLKQTFAKSVNSDEFHIKRAELGGFQVNGGANVSADKNEKLYCFCQCPYDEVSEMIACDAHDCAIEWFHFECVGIMDPPKGKWYCPDCRKKAAAESEMMGIPLR